MRQTSAIPNNDSLLKIGIVVLLQKNDRFLLVKQNKEPYKNFWAPVHGVVEQNETDVAAVIRETKEEIDILVKPIKRLNILDADYKVDELHWWLAEHESGDIKLDTREVSEYGYFTINELMNLKLLPMTRLFFATHYANIDTTNLMT